MPDGLSLEGAAALPMAGVTALQAVRDAGVSPGMDVLVNGASGGVGTFAVQIARSLGATVTGVCGPAHVEATARIGAANVLDHTRQDFTRQGERYDAVIDVAANRPIRHVRRSVKSGGVIVSVGFHSLRRLAGAGLASIPNSAAKRVVMLVADNTVAGDLVTLACLVEAGQVAPVIDGVYPFDHTPAAFAHIGRGHAGGKVVIRLGIADNARTNKTGSSTPT
jgi:NADPH:quinone reductase-like Zn-dependent oxidoreductase